MGSMARASRRVGMLAMLIPWTLLGCATKREPSSTIGPALGHSQPLADASTPEPTPEPVDAQPSEQPPAPVPTEPEQPGDGDPPTAIAPVTEDDEALCRHITRVVVAESNNAAGLSPEQIDELIVSCSLALAHDRRNLSEAEFRRRAACVREASTVAGFSACQPR